MNIEVSTGKIFVLPDITTPVEAQVLALARVCRYSGRTKVFWSVAVHSIIVSEVLKANPREAFYGLIHDLQEFCIGDVLTVIKTDEIREMEFQVSARLMHALKIPLPGADIAAAVKRADVDCYLAELRTVAPENHFPHYHRPIPTKVEALTRKYMRILKRQKDRESWEVQEFLRRYQKLRAKVFETDSQ